MTKLEDVLKLTAQLKEIRDAQDVIMDKGGGRHNVSPAAKHLYDRLEAEAKNVLDNLYELSEYKPASEATRF